MQETLSVISGMLAAVGSVLYARDILRGHCKPKISSWIIWTLLTWIAAVGMYQEGALNWQIGSIAVSDLFILALAVRFSVPGWIWIDLACTVAAIASIGLWATTGDATTGIILSLLATLIAAVPTFESAWRNPRKENRAAWTLMLASSLLSTAAIPRLSWDDAAQPIVFLAITAIMAYLLWIRPRQARLYAPAS